MRLKTDHVGTTPNESVNVIERSAFVGCYCKRPGKKSMPHKAGQAGFGHGQVLSRFSGLRTAV